MRLTARWAALAAGLLGAVVYAYPAAPVWEWSPNGSWTQAIGPNPAPFGAEIVWMGSVSPDAQLLALRTAAEGPVVLWMVSANAPWQHLAPLPAGITQVTAACQLPKGGVWAGTDRGLVAPVGDVWGPAIASLGGWYTPFVFTIPITERVRIGLNNLSSMVPCKERWHGCDWVYVAECGLERAVSKGEVPEAIGPPKFAAGSTFAVGLDPSAAGPICWDIHMALPGTPNWLMETATGGIDALNGELDFMRDLRLSEGRNVGGSGTGLSGGRASVSSGGATVEAWEWLRHDGREIEGALDARGICALYGGRTEAGLLTLDDRTWTARPLPADLLGGVPEFISWASDGRKTIYVGTKQHGVLAYDEKGWRKLSIEGLHITGKDARPAYVAWDSKANCLWVAASTRLTRVPSP